jgi:phospholipase C
MTNELPHDKDKDHGHDNPRQAEADPNLLRAGITRRGFFRYSAVFAGTAAAAAAGAGVGGATNHNAASAASSTGATGTIADIKHVVILMQENRSFDHYFGTLSGVRGFGDKQMLKYPDGRTIFDQPDPSRTDLGYLLPYHMTNQTEGDLDHGWDGDHDARNGGAWNNWVAAKTEECMGYLSRNDIPFHYALADGFTICDGYHQGIMAPTSPNRMYFWTGTSSGWTSNPDDYIVDFRAGEVMTYPEQLEAANVTWQVYTNTMAGDANGPDAFLGDFGDNPLWFYGQYNTTNSRNGGIGELATRGAVVPWKSVPSDAPETSTTTSDGESAQVPYILSSFLTDVKNGALPQVSWIVAPAGYSEHPSYTPAYGADYVNAVVRALMASSLWSSTALFITYDEHDGFFDHQLPPTPETGTTGEFLEAEPIGPGTRVPMIIVSPWTRGGYVDSNVYDHTSMLQFLNTWLTTSDPSLSGLKPVNVTAWRQSVVGDLTAAFDFTKADLSVPTLPTLVNTFNDSQTTGGSTATPAEGDQAFPTQEPGTKPHRPSVHNPNAEVTVDRSSGLVTATLTNIGGEVGVGFSIFPDQYKNFELTPVTVVDGEPGTYTWDTTTTDGMYAFSVYGPDGFVREFSGEVVRSGQNIGPVPVVTGRALGGLGKSFQLFLANEGDKEVVYTLTPNDYEGFTQLVTVAGGLDRVVDWPTDPNGYFDVIITADTVDGYTRRYAGRVNAAVS